MKKLLFIVMMNALFNNDMHAMNADYLDVGPVNWAALVGNMAAIHEDRELQEPAVPNDKQDNKSLALVLYQESAGVLQRTENDDRALRVRRLEERRAMLQRRIDERKKQRDDSFGDSVVTNNKKDNDVLALVIVEKKPLGVKPQLQLTNQPDLEDWDDLGTGEDDDEGWSDEHWVAVDTIKEDDDTKEDDDKEKKD